MTALPSSSPSNPIVILHLPGGAKPPGRCRKTAEQCRQGVLAALLCRLIKGERRRSPMVKLIQTLISGLSLGSIYALIALGYTMVYGIAKMLNFAHGDIIMVGAYAVITSVLTMNLPPVVAILISILVCVVLGVTIEFLAYRPLRQAPPLSVL